MVPPSSQSKTANPHSCSTCSVSSFCLLARSILTANHDNGRLSTKTAMSSVLSLNWNHLRRLGDSLVMPRAYQDAEATTNSDCCRSCRRIGAGTAWAITSHQTFHSRDMGHVSCCPAALSRPVSQKLISQIKVPRTRESGTQMRHAQTRFIPSTGGQSGSRTKPLVRRVVAVLWCSSPSRPWRTGTCDMWQTPAPRTVRPDSQERVKELPGYAPSARSASSKHAFKCVQEHKSIEGEHRPTHRTSSTFPHFAFLILGESRISPRNMTSVPGVSRSVCRSIHKDTPAE